MVGAISAVFHKALSLVLAGNPTLGTPLMFYRYVSLLFFMLFGVFNLYVRCINFISIVEK
jgi:hypothetical protein